MNAPGNTQDSSARRSVVFVCTGNICRSPMAEGLFRMMIGDENGWRVSSAGVGAADGQAPSGHTVAILREQGIELSANRSQLLTRAVVGEASHIFAMTQGHAQAIEAMFPEAAEKTFLVTEFCANGELRGRDVPDPIGMGGEIYRQTFDLLRASLPSVLEFIRQTTRPKSPDPSPDPSSDPEAHP